MIHSTRKWIQRFIRRINKKTEYCKKKEHLYTTKLYGMENTSHIQNMMLLSA
jgi:hypothetical protein